MTSPAPKAVRIAVIGIFVLAAVNLDGLWEVFQPNFQSLVDNIVYQSLSSSPGTPTSAQFDAARSTILVVAAVFSVAVALVLIWLGLKTRGGRRWARVTVTVVVALRVLSLLRSQTQPSSHLLLVGQALELVDLVVSVAVLVLLWAPEDSRSYFRPRQPDTTDPEGAVH
jgi:hypothetical protein